MRRTIVLDDDLLDRARESARKLRKPFRTIVNEALRVGLERIGDVSGRRPYRMVPHDMGLREGLSLYNVQELLSQLEGDGTDPWKAGVGPLAVSADVRHGHQDGWQIRHTLYAAGAHPWHVGRGDGFRQTSAPDAARRLFRPEDPRGEARVCRESRAASRASSCCRHRPRRPRRPPQGASPHPPRRTPSG